MARRNQNHRNNQGKRPAATLDLKAEELSEKEGLEKNVPSDEQTDQVNEVSGVSATSQNDEGAEAELKSSTDDVTGDSDGSSEKAKSSDDGGSEQEGSDKLTPDDHKDLVVTGATGSFFKLLMAGLIGAVAALAGQQFMPRLVTSGAIETTQTLKDQIATLESKVLKLTKEPGVNELSARVAELDKKIESASDGAQNTELSTRINSLEQTLKDLSTMTAGGDEQMAGVTALATKMNNIEERIQSELDNVKTEFSKNLRVEVEQLSKAVAEQESLSQIAGIKLKSTTLGNRIAEIDAQSKKLVADVNKISGVVDGVQSKAISADQLAAELSPVKAELEKINSRIELMSKREAEALEAARHSALAIAFSNLKRAMDRGEGFSAELEAVQQLAGNDVDFSVLKSVESQGIVSEQALLTDFPKLAIKALAVEPEGDEKTGWNKLVTKARTALRYRRTGDIEGEGSEAVLARMEFKFKQGHVEDVLSEAKGLDAKAMLVMQPWLKQLEARLLVESAMQKLEDQLLSSLQPRE